MPKRKHSDLEPNPNAHSSSSSGAKQTRTAQRLSSKFDNDVQSLTRALKVARGFEKQKMGRRGKKARSEEKKQGSVGRIEEEGRILKVPLPYTYGIYYVGGKEEANIVYWNRASKCKQQLQDTSSNNS